MHRLKLLLSTLLFIPIFLTAQIDLELSISTDSPDIGQWTSGTFTLTLANKGPQNATGVQLNFPLNSEEVILVGGSEVLASSGSYQQSTWSGISVAAGESVSLSLQLFSKVPALTLFAEVVAAEQTDSDSTPNNGRANEDDEAHFPSVDIEGMIDLRLSLRPLGDTYVAPLLQFEERGNGAFYINLHNEGNTDATGVKIKVGIPEEHSLSHSLGADSGTYHETTGIWEDISVAAGETVKLVLFFELPDPTFVLFVEVLEADQTDADSTPSNGICCTAQEDDELSFPQESPELEILAVSCPLEFPQPQGELSFDITLRNNGVRASEPNTLGFFRKIRHIPRIDYAISVYEWKEIPSIPPGETQTFTLTYAYPTDEVIFPDTQVQFESAREQLPFFSFDGNLRQFPVDIFCKKVATDINLSLTSENPSFGQDGIFSYQLEIKNEGEEDAYNLQARLAHTYFGNILEESTDFEDSYFMNHGRYVERYWKINRLAAGERATLQIQFQLDSEDGINGNFIFTSTVTSPHLIDSNTNNNSASLTFELNTIDLNLFWDVSDIDVQQGETATYTLTLSNTGSPATGVQVSMPLTEDVALTNGIQPIASTGTYDGQIWENITLPTNGTATLEFQLMSRVPNLQLFAQVIAADQEDQDSTPNNGICCDELEDDEAALLPDLVFTGLHTNYPTIKTLAFGELITGEAVRIDFYLKNQGTAAVRSPVNVNIYLSEDEVLSDDDILLQQIEQDGFEMDHTGKFQELAVSTLLTVPEGVTPNRYHFIVDINTDNYIQELVETNNQISRPIHVINTCEELTLSFYQLFEIDKLPRYYPNCDKVKCITIDGIASNLRGLGHLQQIDSLFIRDTYLKNLSDLRAGSLENGSLYLYNNRELTDITLDNVSRMRTLHISASPKLIHLSLPKLETLRDLSFYSLAELTSLEGLNKLTSIEKSLTIEHVNALTSLSGLDALQTIGQELKIFRNQELLTLNDLSNFRFNSDSPALRIESNPKLEMCHVQGICEQVPTVGIIVNNALACADQEAVEEACSTIDTPSLPDLSLSDIEAPAYMPQGEDIRFNLNINNIGVANAAGEIFVGFYLSEDATWDADDRLVGNIQTGYLGVGSHAAGGLVNIPPHLAAGDYYFISIVDAHNTITESEEGNNVAVQAVRIGSANDLVDIEVELSTPNLNIGQWKAFPVYVRVHNKGLVAANDLSIRLGMCRPNTRGTLFYSRYGVVYENTNYEATQGTYTSLTQYWAIPKLAAGESAELQINLYNVSSEPKYIFAYANQHLEEDIDSSPGNFEGFDNCIASEDDEATIRIYTSTNLSNPSTLSIHPNPVSELLEVEFKGESEQLAQYVVYDIQGQLCMRGLWESTAGRNFQKLDVASLASGTYLLQVIQDETQQSVRFSKW